MRRKTCLLVLLASVVLLFLTGCSQDNHDQFVLVEDSESFAVSLVPLSFSAGTAPAVYSAACGDKIYYLVVFGIPMTNAAERAELYEHDLVTGVSSLLYSHNDPETYWMNELRADGDMVYWTRITTDHNCILEGFDLSTHAIHQIYFALHPIVLGGDHEHLAWYDTVTTNYVDIAFYDTGRQQLFTHSLDSTHFARSYYFFFNTWSANILAQQ